MGPLFAGGAKLPDYGSRKSSDRKAMREAITLSPGDGICPLTTSQAARQL
jgi:hypothetical protein